MGAAYGVYHFSGAIGNDLWKLVRRVQPGDAWHPATDHLKGTDVYGSYNKSLVAHSTFSIRFDDLPCDQLLFATGDAQKWLVATQDSVTGGAYAGAPRPVVRSSVNSQPHTVTWYNRPTHLEDPWVSLLDQHNAISTGDLLYGGNAFRGAHASDLAQHRGANVFCRVSSGTARHFAVPPPSTRVSSDKSKPPAGGGGPEHFPPPAPRGSSGPSDSAVRSTEPEFPCTFQPANLLHFFGLPPTHPPPQIRHLATGTLPQPNSAATTTEDAVPPPPLCRGMWGKGKGGGG